MQFSYFKMRHLLIVVVILLSLSNLIGQKVDTLTFVTANNETDTIQLVFEPKKTFRIGMIANGLKNPGMNLSYEYSLFNSVKKSRKIKIKEYKLNGNIGFYWDPYTHVATYVTAGFLQRKTNLKKRQWLIAINPLGYMRNFTHETYSVDDQNNVSRDRFAGASYYAPEIVFGTGKIKNNRTRYFNFRFMLLLNYNTSFAPLFNFEYGYRF